MKDLDFFQNGQTSPLDTTHTNINWRGNILVALMQSTAAPASTPATNRTLATPIPPTPEPTLPPPPPLPTPTPEPPGPTPPPTEPPIPTEPPPPPLPPEMIRLSCGCHWMSLITRYAWQHTRVCSITGVAHVR